MFHTVLVPLDGTPQSNISLPLVRTLAQATGGSVTLVRVVPASHVRGDNRALREAGQSLERVADELAGGGVAVHPVIREGDDTPHEILGLTQDIAADVIVMRTHGRVGLQRAVLGSVTEQVLAHSSVPLILLRPGGRRVTHIRKLLVPVDGSPGGAVALTTVIDLARATGAAIKVLQIVVPIPTQVYGMFSSGGLAYYDSAWDDDALASAKGYVDAVATRLRGLGLDIEADAQMAPDVPTAIVGAAHEANADLIAMSTQALTGPARALLGSVADAVVRSADCPVLLVHRGS